MTFRQVLLYCILFLSLTLTVPQKGYSKPQDNTKRVSFAEFIDRVEEQTGFSIAYATRDITINSLTLPDLTGLSAQEAIWKVLDRSQYSLNVTGQHIIIKKKPVKEQTVVSPPLRDTGPTNTDDISTGTLPPPQESVLPAETKLVIIRKKIPDTRKPVPVSDRTAHHTSQDEEQTAYEGYNRVMMGNGITALQSDGRDDEPALNRRIPFRSDLLETDVYRKEGEEGDSKVILTRKQLKRNRRGRN